MERIGSTCKDGNVLRCGEKRGPPRQSRSRQTGPSPQRFLQANAETIKLRKPRLSYTIFLSKFQDA